MHTLHTDVQHDSKIAALHASCGACQNSYNTVKCLLLWLLMLLQLLLLLSITPDNLDSHRPGIAMTAIQVMQLTKLQVSAAVLKQQQLCAPAVLEAESNGLQQHAGYASNRYFQHAVVSSLTQQDCALPTSCIAAECKLLVKACTSSHISQQPNQSIAVHLTGFYDAVAITYAVRSHSQFCWVAG